MRKMRKRRRETCNGFMADDWRLATEEVDTENNLSGALELSDDPSRQMRRESERVRDDCM
jgi:hypothetical protein